MLDFQLDASIFVLSKNQHSYLRYLEKGVPRCKGHTASMRTVKPHDPQNTFSGWKGWGLRPGKEQRTGVGIPAVLTFRQVFPQASIHLARRK